MLEGNNSYKKVSKVRRMRNVKDVGVVILNKIVSEILSEEEGVKRKARDITIQTSQKF